MKGAPDTQKRHRMPEALGRPYGSFAPVRGHVPRCRNHDLRVVLQVPDPYIAAMAEQAAHMARHVVMVDVPRLSAAAGFVGLADGAPIPLQRNETVPICLRQSIGPQCAAPFLGAKLLC